MSKSSSILSENKEAAAATASIAHIGFGYWGKNILRNLHHLGALHTACDINPEVVAHKRNEYPDVRFAMDVESIWKDPAIKAVCIATPAATHYELVKQALEADKDVFVEKPLALHVKEGEELRDLARQKKKILMVGHILQYHPAITALKEMVRDGKLGKVEYIYSNRLNIGKFRTEENILWSFAPHDISVILSLMGRTPRQVGAFGGDIINKGIYDTTLTTLDFDGGVKAHIFVSWLHPYKEQKLIVVGSKGMAVFDDVSREKLFYYPHSIQWQDGKIPVAEKADFLTVPVNSREPLQLELEHFIDAVSRRTTPLTDAAEGVRVLKVLQSAEKALVSSAADLPLVAEASERKDYFVHETACIDENVVIGKGTKIWHFSHLLGGTKVGENCNLGQNVMAGPGVTIGSGCKIQNNVSVYKGVTLEEDVFCGPSCVFTNVYAPRAFIDQKSKFRDTLVRRGATIGANATIVCGVTLGKFCLVAAGAVVRKDVPDYAVVAGVPARQIGWVCRCGMTLIFQETSEGFCAACGTEYELHENSLHARD